MPTNVEAFQAEVLSLSPADRSRLLASLDEDAEIEAEWDAIADKRQAEVAKSVPLSEATALLEARFPG